MRVYLRTLLIAPDLGLEHVSNEIRAISASLQATVLADEVTRRDVMDAMSNKEWDVVWAAAHGTRDGILLSDGLLTTSDFTSIVRNTGADLLMINTCDSKITGLELNYELGIDVVCVEGEVGDSGAYQMGRFFAQHLANGIKAKDAFDKAKPGQNTRYHFLFGRRDEHGEDIIRPDSRIDDARTIRMMREVVDDWGGKIDKRIDGMESSLRGEIESLRGIVRTLQVVVENSVSLPPWHKEAFATAFGLLFLPVPLFYVQVRTILDVGWQLSLVLAALAYLSSAALWSYMWWGNKK